MKRKWIIGAILCSLSLAVPSAVSAAEQNDWREVQLQAEENSDTGDTVVPGSPEFPDKDHTADEPYQAVEGTNGQGLKTIANPLWEYSEAGGGIYRLLKTRTAEGQTAYYTLADGVLQLGTAPGYYYAFDVQGNMITDTKVINGIRYYFTPQAKAVQSTVTITPNQTTLGMAVRNCWMKVNSCWFYFNNIGQQDVSKTGLQKISGSYFYLSKSFVPYASKWVRQSSGAWWYFNKDGKYNSSLVNSRKINGSWYYLNKKGIPYKSCFKTVNKRKYYYGTSGKRASYTGWKSIKKRQYYFSKKHFVVKKSGWQKINGKSYYFSKKGVMYADKWANIGGKQYYFKANGRMAAGWTKIGKTYYCFTSSGTLDRSTVAKQGNNYYFVTPQGTRGANILNGVGVTAAMSSGTKLQTCFNYVVRNCGYMGGPVWPPRGWEPYHAYKMLTTRRGNCYDFAAAFCYLAKAVGYEGMICISGQCASASGGYTPHSWCEYGGMVFDPEISYANGLYLFNVSYGSLPFGYIR